MFIGAKAVVQRTASIGLLGILLIQGLVSAENKLSLRKGVDNSLLVLLSNSDPVAGIQFSLSARGGVILQSLEGAERIKRNGWAIYQHNKDDSTLNVVMLAPIGASLSSDEGAIGMVSYAIGKWGTADTAYVSLSGVEMCDVNARILDVSTAALVWKLGDASDVQATSFILEQNFPNPFSAKGACPSGRRGSASGGNPSTTITYTLEKPATVELILFDITGRAIRKLVSAEQRGGRYDIRWNGDDETGFRVPSGIYFARLSVDSQVAVRKLLLTR